MREKHAKKYGPVLPENMTPHTMRHTFCTNMAHAGMNPKALQYVMGHADIKITMGYYAHTDPVAATDNMRRTLEEPASVA
jgi:integrase